MSLGQQDVRENFQQTVIVKVTQGSSRTRADNQEQNVEKSSSASYH